MWKSKIGFYVYWFEYLALSQSFHLAHMYRTGKLTDDQKAQLPADFERVLEVYDHFGDVQRGVFYPWWRERGMELCGHESDAPKVASIGSLGKKAKNTDRITSRLDSYFEEKWVEQGCQNTLIVAIPIGLSKSAISKQINRKLDRASKEHRIVKPAPAKYPLLGKRQNPEMLFRYMNVLIARGETPDSELWRVGVRSKVSETYSSEIHEHEEVLRSTDSYDRMMLTILTSRALNRAQMIAENAARGEFPTYRKCAYAVKFDYVELHHRWASRKRWEQEVRDRRGIKSQSDW